MAANYTPSQVDSAFAALWRRISQDVKPATTPLGIILGGQPGAGKTYVMTQILAPTPCVIINGDEFRKEHPLHQHLIEDEVTYSENTQAFANELAQRCLEAALTARLPLLIEGTMRNPEVAINTAQRLQEQGYIVHAHVVTTPPEHSWHSCQARYQRQKILQGFGRQVDKVIHDQAVAALPNSVARLIAGDTADTVTIHNRKGIVFVAQFPQDAEQAAEWVIRCQVI